jgi:hypothetical protein
MPSTHRRYFTTFELILLALLSALVVVSKIVLRLPLKLPGHSGVFWMAILIVARDMDGPPLEYLRLSFNNVMITSVMLGAMEGSSNIVETATIEFTGFTEEYFQQSPTGSTGTGISVSYDIRTSQIT